LSDELRILVAALVSFAAALTLVPAAIRLAVRTGFLDHPAGHKVHSAATPYLGGAAIMCAFAIGALVGGEAFGRFWPILAGAAGLALVGTIDDRRFIAPRYRVAAELLAAGLLTVTGTGWTFLSGGGEQFLLNAVWVVGFVNALNLMDNVDGAAASVGGVCAAGIGALAIVQGDGALAATMVALAGACAGFLVYNLPRRGSARIFMGDGGSMPLGFLLAAGATRVPLDGGLGWPILLTAGMLLAVPVLDTLLVVVSRSRRDVSLLTGGQDHLTHRLRARLGSTRAVVVRLALLQATVAAVAIVAFEAGRGAIVATAAAAIVIGCAIVAALDRPTLVVRAPPPVSTERGAALRIEP
jgi:UDP-GlcNAc:undecaprenyl-phosphate GlcNAc-1-phosphate transferase